MSIVIYDAGGRLIRTLKLGYQDAGAYISKDRAAYWDGKDENGRRLPVVCISTPSKQVTSLPQRSW